jgi:hypothetical protein
MLLEWWAVLMILAVLYGIALLSMGGHLLDALALVALPAFFFAVIAGGARLLMYLAERLR